MDQMWAQRVKKTSGKKKKRGHLGRCGDPTLKRDGPERSREGGEVASLIKDLTQVTQTGLGKPSNALKSIQEENMHFKPLAGRVQNQRRNQTPT